MCSYRSEPRITVQSKRGTREAAVCGAPRRADGCLRLAQMRVVTGKIDENLGVKRRIGVSHVLNRFILSGFKEFKERPHVRATLCCVLNNLNHSRGRLSA